MALPVDHDVRLRRARLALDGLSVGDAFGERFVLIPGSVEDAIASRLLPEPPWKFTDDTMMALAITDVLERSGAIDREEVAAALAARWFQDPTRDYGQMAHWTLASIRGGLSWAEAAESVYEGAGSMGNGAAVRAAPIGAYFADDGLERVAREARASAEVTHKHPDGQAGAIAVAIAAAMAARMGEGRAPKSGKDLLDAALEHTPDSATRQGLSRARTLLSQKATTAQAASTLGTGEGKPFAGETVPFALYCAAVGLGGYIDTLWSTVAGGGDVDTTCAMAGAIAALGGGAIPAEWIAARERLP